MDQEIRPDENENLNIEEMLAENAIAEGYVTADSEAFWMTPVEESLVAVEVQKLVVETEVTEVIEMTTGPESQSNTDDLLMDADLLKAIDAIPDKMAFKIGEAAEILDIRPYVLRYWESEFDELKPKKSNHNQRMYSRNDVKVAMMIKKLLYKDRFSIEGARKAIKRLRSSVKQEVEKKAVQTKIDRSFDRLHELVEDLAGLKQLFT